MIGRIDSQNNVPENVKKNSGIKSTVVKNTKSVNSPSPAVRTAASVAAAAGLPGDKLSASIVSFARFFSLSLKPNLLAAIRQQVVSVPVNNPVLTAAENMANQNTGSSSAAAKMREALSLAAAAAESKGVELSPKGLESYAEAVDPDLNKKREEDKRERRSKNENDSCEKSIKKENVITAEDLKKMANDNYGKDPLLDILNRLPGKNGQRWIVLPFNFYEDDKEFKVSLRILLENEDRATGMAVHVSVNNDKSEEGIKQKWGFGVDFLNDKISKVIIYFKPFINDKNETKLIQELSENLQIPVNKILIKTSQLTEIEDYFPYETDFDENLLSISEVV